MESTMPMTAVSSALGATVNIAIKGFEVCAVDEQARSLLKTVDQVAGQLRHARVMRRQKSSLLSVTEKKMIDETFRYTEEAVSEVAALAEPSRADMEVSGGQVRFKTRLLFVLRDSPKIQVCLTQLGIASSGLNRDIGVLCSREGRATIATMGDVLKPPPPTYEETLLISEQRRRNIRRRASALSVNRDPTRSSSLTTALHDVGPLAEAQPVAPEVTALDNHQMPGTPEIRLSESQTDELAFEAFSEISTFTAFPNSRRARSGRERSLQWFAMQYQK